MPESVSFTVGIYRKLAKDEVGLTSLTTRRIPLGTALEVICDELPDEAWTVTRPDDEGDVVNIRIDWSKVPDGIVNPKLPARRR